MSRSRASFLFLNVGHFLDHLVVLVFATAAALSLTQEWSLTYAELIPYATPGLVAFGLCSLPAGWLADRWSREGMLVIFFLGIGASTLLASLADGPLEMALGLTLIGCFAAIYHPVGLALVVQGRERTGVPLAINGIFGNMGVACAALLTGFLIDHGGWRSAFVVPGVLSIAVGLGYWWFVRAGRAPSAPATASASGSARAETPPYPRHALTRIFAIIFLTTALGGLIFQATTFSLPEVFDERLAGLGGSATRIGGYAFLVFAVAAFAQLAVGYLVDHHAVRTVFAAVALLQALFLAAMIQLSGLWALLASLAFMLAVFGQIPINDVLVGRVTRGPWRSRAFAARYIVTFSVSATAVPLIAWLRGGWGFEALFSVLAGTAFLVFLAALALPPSRSVATAPATA